MTSDVQPLVSTRSGLGPQQLSEDEFYAGGLDEAGRVVLRTARRMKGLDEEIAMLRKEVRDFHEKQPEAFIALLQGLDVLRKMVASRYRMSQAAEHDLDASLAHLIQSIYGQFQSAASDE